MAVIRISSIVTVLLCLLIKDSNAVCGPEWKVVGKRYCYFEGDARLTWKDARLECKNRHSLLIRLDDDSVKNDLKTLLKSSNSTRWWTGLNDIAKKRVWMYDTGVNAAYPQNPRAINWIAEPDDTRHLQNCVALNFEGSISDERCSDFHRYICEYENTDGGACVDGWKNYTTGCYRFPSGEEDVWSERPWDEAVQKCKTALDGTRAAGSNPHIIYIDHISEMKFVISVLRSITLTAEIWWIGLSDKQKEGKFVWNDGSDIGQHVYWAHEPNNLGAQEKCTYTNRNGALGDLDCTRYENYVCMKGQDGNTVSERDLGCPDSWTRAGQYCYLLETNNKQTWADARTSCSQSGANLMKVDTLDKKFWLDFRNDIFESGLWFWTGLSTQNRKNWQWTDGTAANMSLIAWLEEPNNYKGHENCAVIKKSGRFNDVYCETKAGFICEMNIEDIPCPDTWSSFNIPDQTNCYYIGDTLGTYIEAKAQCKAVGYPMTTELVAINSVDELNYIKKLLAARNSAVTMYFTGLTDIDHEGIWLYDTPWNPKPKDGLIPWEKSPSFPDGDENCVAILFGGQYVNTKCTEQRAYICEMPANGVNIASANAGHRLPSQNLAVVSVLAVVMTYFLGY